MESDHLFKLISTSSSGGQANAASLGSMRRLDALFRAMATDYLLREQFVTSPSSVIFDYVYGVQLQPQQAEVSDQLIHSVMSSRQLLEWLHERGFQPGGSSTRNAFAESVRSRCGRAWRTASGYGHDEKRHGRAATRRPR